MLVSDVCEGIYHDRVDGFLLVVGFLCLIELHIVAKCSTVTFLVCIVKCWAVSSTTQHTNWYAFVV